MKDEIINKLNELKIKKVNQAIEYLRYKNNTGLEGFFEDYIVTETIDYLGRSNNIVWSEIVQIKSKSESIKALVQLSFRIMDDLSIEYDLWRREDDTETN